MIILDNCIPLNHNPTVSFDEEQAWSDAAREEYEGELASRTLEEEGVRYALEEKPQEVEAAVREWQADRWLEESHDWLELINIVSQHDREQLRNSVRYRALFGSKTPQLPEEAEAGLFNLASDVSKFLETHKRTFSASSGGQFVKRVYVSESIRDEYRPVLVPSLALYAEYCDVSDDVRWVSELVTLTRAFRDILFAIGDPQSKRSLEWELSQHIRVVNAALERGTCSRLIYTGFARRHQFGREPYVEKTPLVSFFASWISEYLASYSERIDLGACVECGKIFSRQRSDNAYCSKTCQNRVAYKRKRIFETGLLERIEVTFKNVAEKLQQGVWVYHPRLGLGFVRFVDRKRRTPSSFDVQFTHVVRTFAVRQLFGSDSGRDGSKIEFYKETNAAALAELL